MSKKVKYCTILNAFHSPLELRAALAMRTAVFACLGARVQAKKTCQMTAVEHARVLLAHIAVRAKCVCALVARAKVARAQRR